MERLVTERGIKIRLNAAVAQLVLQNARATAITLTSGEVVAGDIFVSTVPASVYRTLCAADRTPQLDRIAYTALVSLVCATPQAMPRDFYWLNLATGRHTAAAIFNLTSLNPTIGAPGETCLNFVTHLRSAADRRFAAPESEIVDGYLADFQRVFGFALEPSWVHLSRLPIYSPVFVTNYRPPPMQSTSADNVFFAGNYCASPSVASTGTALASGLATADCILQVRGTMPQ